MEWNSRTYYGTVHPSQVPFFLYVGFWLYYVVVVLIVSADIHPSCFGGHAKRMYNVYIEPYLFWFFCGYPPKVMFR